MDQIDTRPARAPAAVVRRALLPVKVTAGAAGISPAQVYAFARAGRLRMVKLGGRTLVTRESLQALLDSAVPYVPDGSNPRGRARARASEAAQRSA